MMLLFLFDGTMRARGSIEKIDMLDPIWPAVIQTYAIQGKIIM